MGPWGSLESFQLGGTLFSLGKKKVFHVAYLKVGHVSDTKCLSHPKKENNGMWFQIAGDLSSNLSGPKTLFFLTKKEKCSIPKERREFLQIRKLEFKSKT